MESNPKHAILILQRLRQEEPECETALGYRERPRLKNKRGKEVGCVVYNRKLSTQGWRQEDQEFKVSLGCGVG